MRGRRLLFNCVGARRPLQYRSVSMVLLAAGLCAAFAGSAISARATMPAANGRIVYRQYLDVGRTAAALFTVNSNGTKVRRLTHPDANVIDTEPDWSPDATRIAFERKAPCPADHDGLNNTCDLVYTVKRNGKGLRSVIPCQFTVGNASGTPNTDCVGVDDPAWSPGGSRLAFQYNLVNAAFGGSLNLEAGIWVVDADGSGLHQVTQRTPGSSWDFGPQWSPDGTRLVFYRADLGLHADAVFTVNVDGSGEFQVTPWSLGGGDHPDWSPDGQWLLFRGEPGDGSPDGAKITTARTPGTGPEGAADVFVMKADGSNIRPVTKTRLWDSASDWGPRK
jgi:Tol biopolymer transport system component